MTQTRKLEDKVFSYMEKYHMLLPGGRVVAGISGGADSVCLLFVLLEWKRRYGLEIAVVHVDHGIRAEAGEDACFVEELCRRQGLSFHLCRADIPKQAAEWKCSEEEAGRNFRYQSFARIAEEFGADRIAVAHHLNDRCETMLFHLFRGSGVRGLGGIPPVREMGSKWIIRPLLNIQRSEIEEYLAERGQPYCQDKTNEEDNYTRNRIRHHILPYVEEHIVKGCVQRMGQTAELLEETEDYLKLQTRAARAECVRDGAWSGEGTMSACDDKAWGYTLDCQGFAKLHPAIRKRLLHELLAGLSPHAKDIGQVHVAGLEELLLRQGNRQIDLPFGIRGRRAYEETFLWREKINGVSTHVKEEAMALSGNAILDIGMEQELKAGFQVLSRIFSIEDLPRNQENFLIFPSNKYTKWFDYDKMKESPVFRTRAAGDYLTIRGSSGEMCHKKLKDYMVNEKISARQRDLIPVLAEDSHILWLVGYRISEYYKVTENTKRVLQVQLKRETGCGSSHTEEKDGGKN